MLNETPWVNAADRESEQKQRLADFFDENGLNNRMMMAVEKLQKLQNADGSFSWYPSMQGSTQITVAIEEMLVRLHKMAGEQQSIKQMQQNAFNYISQEMMKLVNEMKKEEKKGPPCAGSTSVPSTDAPCRPMYSLPTTTSLLC